MGRPADRGLTNWTGGRRQRRSRVAPQASNSSPVNIKGSSQPFLGTSHLRDRTSTSCCGCCVSSMTAARTRLTHTLCTVSHISWVFVCLELNSHCNVQYWPQHWDVLCAFFFSSSRKQIKSMKSVHPGQKEESLHLDQSDFQWE